MKVLILNYEFPPLGGGAGNATYHLLKEWSGRSDLEVDLVTSALGKERAEEFSSNIKIYYLDIGKKKGVHHQSLWSLVRYTYQAYFFCQNLLRQESYDLVHAFFGVPGGWLASKFGLPYVISLRGSDVPFYNPRFFWLDRLFLSRLSRHLWSGAETVVANSLELKNLALKVSPSQAITLIPNGVDTEKFQPGKEEKKSFVILSTSRLIKRKGLEYLLSAFLSFNKKYPDSELWLVGEGNLKKDLMKQSKDAKGKVIFYGSLPHGDLPSLYQKASVFVLPSLNEGMSNSLLEALASGLAVIVTDTGGTRELVNEDNGIIVSKKSSEEIGSALIKLYLDPNLTEYLGEQGCRQAKNFDWGSAASAYLSFYESASKKDEKN